MSEGAFGTYDFGLSKDEELRASRLFGESIVVDVFLEHQAPIGHRSYDEAMSEELRTLAATDPHANLAIAAKQLPVRLAIRGKFPLRKAWDETGITAAGLQVLCDDLGDLVRQFSLVQAQFDHFLWLTKALTAKDIVAAHALGEHAAWVYTEDVLAMNRDPALAGVLAELGFRMVGLTYNRMNAFGSGCGERVDGGLSREGIRMVERLNELGVMVDIAHAGTQTGLDVCRVSEAPVVASHTTAAHLFEHPRAKPDHALAAVAQTGGLIGVAALPAFLAAEPDGATVDAMLDHIDHIVSVVGAEHVGIGSDWPPQAPRWMIDEIFAPAAPDEGVLGLSPEISLIGFDDHRDMRNIARGLVARRYCDDDIIGILGGNFLRVMETACG
jgi:membrane dipeptidase